MSIESCIIKIASPPGNLNAGICTKNSGDKTGWNLFQPVYQFSNNNFNNVNTE